jgi:hypothetical protein
MRCVSGKGVVDKLCKKLCARTAFAIDRRNPRMKSRCGNASHWTYELAGKDRLRWDE